MDTLKILIKIADDILSNIYGTNKYPGALQFKRKVLDELESIQSKLSAGYRISNTGITNHSIKSIVELNKLVFKNSGILLDKQRTLKTITEYALSELSIGNEVDHRIYRGTTLYDNKYGEDLYESDPELYDHLMNYSPESVIIYFGNNSTINDDLNKIKKILKGKQ